MTVVMVKMLELHAQQVNQLSNSKSLITAHSLYVNIGQFALMVTSGCQPEEVLLKVEWRSAVVVHGGLSVMISGV